MGGDGGVIASNRRFMRGAGTADQTADASRNRGEQTSEKDIVVELMTLCYLTKAPLNFVDNLIVSDPYGRLYHKEAVVEALLRRKKKSKDSDELGEHIRGLKDLHPVHFELSASNTPICPISSVELNGINPAFLVPSRKDGGVNVISDRAIKELGKEALKEDYGDLDDLIRLAPPPSMMEAIMTKTRIQHEKEKYEKEDRTVGKKNKKHKRNDESEKMSCKPRKSNDVSDAAKGRVQKAMESNQVLSSLFSTSEGRSLKRKAENLFSINHA